MKFISIRTLKIIFRFVRRTKERLPRSVFALIIVVILMGTTTFFLATLEMLRWYIERDIQSTLITTLRTSNLPEESVTRTIEILEKGREESLPQRIFRVLSEPFRGETTDSTERTDYTERIDDAEGGPLILSSFSDLFSGTGWLDEVKTTLYQDEMVTALTFPPRFEMEPIGTAEVEFRERRVDGSDMLCIWNDCLVERNGALFFVPFVERHAYADARYALPLPASVASLKILSLSIGKLETVWLVGAVVEPAGLPAGEAGEYEGHVFVFDGARYSPALDAAPAPLASRYPGTLGFGGADNDWLVVYGGYEGIAYRIRGNDRSSIITNHSSLFGIRVMENGFAPLVLRSKIENCGLKIENCTVWYIGSMTEGKPKLIKLFENGDGVIAGALDLTRDVFPIGTNAAALAVDGAGRRVVKLKIGDEVAWRELRDLGFVKDSAREAVSKNLNTYTNAEVRRATITEFDASPAGGTIELFLSNDGATWLPAVVGEEVVFPNPSGTALLWRARVTPIGANELSPFLDRINLQFGIKSI